MLVCARCGFGLDCRVSCRYTVGRSVGVWMERRPKNTDWGREPMHTVSQLGHPTIKFIHTAKAVCVCMSVCVYFLLPLFVWSFSSRLSRSLARGNTRARRRGNLRWKNMGIQCSLRKLFTLFPWFSFRKTLQMRQSGIYLCRAWGFRQSTLSYRLCVFFINWIIYSIFKRIVIYWLPSAPFIFGSL